MDFFRKGYEALQGDKGQPQTGPETIERLCERAQNSTLLEDRRAAVLSLKALAKDFQLDVGTRGMPILITVLTEDRSDVEILRAALETINIVCTAQTLVPDDQDLGVMFTEIFVKKTSNVSLLLGLLEVYDFYVRYHTITLLTLLLENRPRQLQSCILESPLGVSRLMDLLDDPREIIRNEGLLLLISLTKANADIQKIVAFENAFDRLLTVIYDEGLSDGGIIVSDCLHLIHNLLRGNASNQNYFRETSCFQRLPDLFRIKNSDAPQTLWSEQKQTNLSLIMDLVRLFVSHRAKSSSASVATNSGKAPNSTATNQTALLQNGVLAAVSELGLAQDVPPRIKYEALLTIADIIRGLPAAQDAFARLISRPGSTVFPGSPPPSAGVQDAVLHLIALAVATTTPWNIRAAAAHAFKCFLYKRSDLQLVLISSLTAMPPSSKPGEGLPADAPGPLLFKSLVEWETARKDPYQVWLASLLLSSIVKGDNKAKEKLLETRIPSDGDDEPAPFLSLLSHALLTANDDGGDVRVVVAYLSLLATILFQFPKGIAAFLREGSNIQYLIEQVSKSSGGDVVIQGLAAFVMGIILQFNDNKEPTLRRSDLHEIISSRIGEEHFLQRLQALRDSDAFKTETDLTAPFKPSDAKPIPSLLFDTDFLFFFAAVIEGVERVVIEQPNDDFKEASRNPDEIDPSTANAIVESYKGIIRDQDAQLESLRKELISVKNALSTPTTPATTTNVISFSELDELRSEIETLRGTTRLLSQENEQLKQQNAALMAQIAQGIPSKPSPQVEQLMAELERERASHKELQAEQNDLLVLLGEQGEETAKLKDRLRALGEIIEEDDDDLEEEQGEEV